MCWRLSDLLLRALLRSACLLSYRAALSLPLVRYCLPFRHLPRLPVHCLRADDAMSGSASRLSCRLAARSPFPRFPFPVSRSAILPAKRGGDGVVLSLACLFASSDLWRCPRAGVRFLSLGRVRCHDACGELTGTARVPMIG